MTGLLQAIRDGVVAVTNSIGSSLAQMPALLPYMAAANRFFFGDEMVLAIDPDLLVRFARSSEPGLGAA